MVKIQLTQFSEQTLKLLAIHDRQDNQLCEKYIPA